MPPKKTTRREATKKNDSEARGQKRERSEEPAAPVVDKTDVAAVATCARVKHYYDDKEIKFPLSEESAERIAVEIWVNHFEPYLSELATRCKLRGVLLAGAHAGVDAQDVAMLAPPVQLAFDRATIIHAQVQHVACLPQLVAPGMSIASRLYVRVIDTVDRMCAVWLDEAASMADTTTPYGFLLWVLVRFMHLQEWMRALKLIMHSVDAAVDQMEEDPTFRTNFAVAACQSFARNFLAPIGHRIQASVIAVSESLLAGGISDSATLQLLSDLIKCAVHSVPVCSLEALSDLAIPVFQALGNNHIEAAAATHLATPPSAINGLVKAALSRISEQRRFMNLLLLPLSMGDKRAAAEDIETCIAKVERHTVDIVMGSALMDSERTATMIAQEVRVENYGIVAHAAALMAHHGIHVADFINNVICTPLAEQFVANIPNPLTLNDMYSELGRVSDIASEATMLKPSQPALLCQRKFLVDVVRIVDKKLLDAFTPHVLRSVTPRMMRALALVISVTRLSSPSARLVDAVPNASVMKLFDEAKLTMFGDFYRTALADRVSSCTEIDHSFVAQEQSKVQQLCAITTETLPASFASLRALVAEVKSSVDFSAKVKIDKLPSVINMSLYWPVPNVFATTLHSLHPTDAQAQGWLPEELNTLAVAYKERSAEESTRRRKHFVFTPLAGTVELDVRVSKTVSVSLTFTTLQACILLALNRAPTVDVEQLARDMLIDPALVSNAVSTLAAKNGLVSVVEAVDGVPKVYRVNRASQPFVVQRTDYVKASNTSPLWTMPKVVQKALVVPTPVDTIEHLVHAIRAFIVRQAKHSAPEPIVFNTMVDRCIAEFRTKKGVDLPRSTVKDAIYNCISSEFLQMNDDNLTYFA